MPREHIARATADRTPALLVAHGGLRFVLFPIPIVTIFWIDQLGMSLGDVLWLQAVFAAAVVTAEFPSGYLADRVGHRTALLVGAALWAVAWVLYARATAIADVVVAEVVLGTGLAFASGADAALLYRALALRGAQDDYLRWEGRTRAAMQGAESASSAIGGVLYGVAPRLPFWLQVPVGLASVACAGAMREPPRAPQAARRAHLRAALHLVRHTLWRHPRLRSAVALHVALSLPSFLMVWLVQAYMRDRGIPLAWFGPIWAAANAWLAVVSLLSARVAATLGRRRTLLGCCLLAGAGYALMAATHAAWGVVFYLCLMTLRGLQGPILTATLQRDAPDEDRASVLSLATLCFRSAVVVLGPAVGRLVDTVGLDGALPLMGAGFAAASLAALFPFVRAHGRG